MDYAMTPLTVTIDGPGKNNAACSPAGATTTVIAQQGQGNIVRKLLYCNVVVRRMVLSGMKRQFINHARFNLNQLPFYSLPLHSVNVKFDFESGLRL
jgi:hypothetical protein